MFCQSIHRLAPVHRKIIIKGPTYQNGVNDTSDYIKQCNEYSIQLFFSGLPLDNWNGKWNQHHCLPIFWLHHESVVLLSFQSASVGMNIHSIWSWLSLCMSDKLTIYITWSTWPGSYEGSHKRYNQQNYFLIIILEFRGRFKGNNDLINMSNSLTETYLMHVSEIKVNWHV